MKIFILVPLLFLCAVLQAQVQLNKEKAVYGPGVKPGDISYISSGIEQLLSKYTLNADLYDSATGEISATKMDNFGTLFTSDALIAPDYLVMQDTSELSLTDFATYMLDVFERMNHAGVPFSLSNIRLEQINYNEGLRRFESEVLADKKLVLGLLPDGSIQRYPSGKKVTQRITFVAERAALTESLILRIKTISLENVALPTPVVVAQREPEKVNVEKPASVVVTQREPEKVNVERPTPVVVAQREPEKPTPAKSAPAVVAEKPTPAKPAPVVEKPIVHAEESTSKPVKPAVEPRQNPPAVVAETSKAGATGMITLLTERAKIDESLQGEQKSKAIGALQSALNEYNQYAKMLDPTSGTVNDKYLQKFEKLFNSQGKVYNDILNLEPEPGELTHFSDYASIVYSNLQTKGVKFAIVSAELEKIDRDFDDYYKASVLIKKEMYHSLVDGKGGMGLVEEETPVSKPRAYPLRMNYYFKLGTTPKINTIESAQEVCIREKEEKLVTVYSRYGYSLVQSSLSSAWTNSIAEDALSVEAKGTIGLGVQLSSNRFYKDRACRKPFFWTLGAAYYKTTVQTNVKDLKYQYLQDAAHPDYLSEVEVKAATQINQFQAIEGLVGLRYRFLSGFNTTAFLDFGVLPSYIVTTSTRFDLESGEKILYDGIIVNGADSTRISTLPGKNPNSTFIDAYGGEDRFIDEFGVGEKLLREKSVAKSQQTLGLSTRLGLSIYKRLGYSWGLSMGVDFNYNLSSPVRFNDRKDVLFADSGKINEQGSLLNDYVSKFNQHTIGIRLGLYYRMK